MTSRWVLNWHDNAAAEKAAYKVGYKNEKHEDYDAALGLFDYVDMACHQVQEVFDTREQAVKRGIKIMTPNDNGFPLDSFGSVDIRKQILTKERMYDGFVREVWEYDDEDSDHYTLEDLQGAALAKATA